MKRTLSLLAMLGVLLTAAGWLHPSTVHAATSASSCDSPRTIEGLPDVAQRVQCLGGSRKLWVVAELHGTQEIPGLVQALVERESAAGPVALALEIPSFEQPALDAYLASPGSAADVQRWLNEPFWSAGQRDGRSSQAMQQLIEQVRLWRIQGRSIAVVLTDPGYHPDEFEKAGGPMAFKEQGMVQAIRRALESGSRVIALMGSFHARHGSLGTIPGVTLSSRSVVDQLADRSPLLIWVSAARGNAWNCVDDCGVREMGDDGDIARPELSVLEQQASPVRTLMLKLPAFNASRPAIESLNKTQP